MTRDEKLRMLIAHVDIDSTEGRRRVECLPAVRDTHRSVSARGQARQITDPPGSYYETKEVITWQPRRRPSRRPSRKPSRRQPRRRSNDFFSASEFAPRFSRASANLFLRQLFSMQQTENAVSRH